jgi:hypothetical protein
MRAWIQMAVGGGGAPYYQNLFDAEVTGAYGWGMALMVVNHFGSACLNYNGSQLKFASTVVVDDGNWHELVMTMSAANAYLYIDGALAATAGHGQNAVMSNDNPNNINSGRGGLAFKSYTGLIAEPKMSQAVLDAGTIATEWANQSSPGTFYSVGNSQSGPAPQNTSVAGNPAWTVTHVSGALTADAPIFGNGGGDVKIGTKTGSTDQMQCASGAAGATGSPLKYDASGNAVAGVVGQFVPAGGAAAQVLTKNSSADYDDAWTSVSSGDVLVNSTTTQCAISVNGSFVADVPTVFYVEGTYRA